MGSLDALERLELQLLERQVKLAEERVAAGESREAVGLDKLRQKWQDAQSKLQGEQAKTASQAILAAQVKVKDKQEATLAAAVAAESATTPLLILPKFPSQATAPTPVVISPKIVLPKDVAPSFPSPSVILPPSVSSTAGLPASWNGAEAVATDPEVKSVFSIPPQAVATEVELSTSSTGLAFDQHSVSSTLGTPASDIYQLHLQQLQGIDTSSFYPLSASSLLAASLSQPTALGTIAAPTAIHSAVSSAAPAVQASAPSSGSWAALQQRAAAASAAASATTSALDGSLQALGAGLDGAAASTSSIAVQELYLRHYQQLLAASYETPDSRLAASVPSVFTNLGSDATAVGTPVDAGKALQELSDLEEKVKEAEEKVKRAAAQSHHYVGLISKFDTMKGYGFVSCSETFKRFGRDIFIDRESYQGARIGDTVVFSVGFNKKGEVRACDVQKLNEVTRLKQELQQKKQTYMVTISRAGIPIQKHIDAMQRKRAAELLEQGPPYKRPVGQTSEL